MIEFLFKRHGIEEIVIGFVTRFRICLIIFICGMLLRYLNKIPVLDNIIFLHNIADRFNIMYANVITFEDNILTPIFQFFENIIHVNKEFIFAMMVTIVCVWLVIFKGVLWGIAVIFLIYNGGGMLPLLAIGFVIDIIINMIVYKTPLGN